jgi:parallel beta-helix repeat protein
MFSKWFGLRRQNKQRRRRQCFVPRLEALEDRWLPSISVTSVADSGTGSLRDAINQANLQPGSTIDFTMLGPGTHTINVASTLPDITAAGVTITADPMNQEIRLNGLSAGNTNGLAVLGNNCTINGLTIENFGSAGILVEGTGDTVSGCNIGTTGHNGNGVYIFQDVGVTLQGNDIENNTADGVLIFDSAGITIDSNIMEHNANNGIRVEGQMAGSGQPFVTKIVNNQIDLNAANGIDVLDSSNNLIGQAGALQSGGNTIGSDKFGILNEPNSGDGVLIESSGSGVSANNILTENFIGGNNGNGVALTGPGTSNNSLVNNRIGWGYVQQLDSSGGKLTTLPNKLDGVAISGGAHDNIVGGVGLFLNADPKNGAGNLIDANLGNGVRLSDAGTTGNAVLGNLIGTDPSGASALANGQFGVAVTNGASNNLIGGAGLVHTSFGYGNLISGNTFGGVDLNGTGTMSNLVEGNFIGTDAFGAAKLANTGAGVTIEKGASANTVDLDNLISGNAGHGVQIGGVGTTGNLVQQNRIGTNLLGTSSLGNLGTGVLIYNGATANTIGGVPADSTFGNLISGNHGNGVEIAGVGTSNNLVQGNLIGTNSTGTGALPNTGDGVLLFNKGGSNGNTIGGAVPSSGNLISGNGRNGIQALGAASVGNLIQGNTIGTDESGKIAIANQRNGVLINNTTGYEIGGVPVTAGNLISGNILDGVKITGSLSSHILVMNNHIGTDVNAAVALANHGNGVEIVNQAHQNFVGPGNVISGNFGDGVRISQGASLNVVRGNHIGTDATGTAYVPNQGNGVNIFDAGHNIVGGSGEAAGNLISGNIHDGVRLANGAFANWVLGNMIGTDVSGTAPLRNLADGVHILTEASNNLIGVVSAGGTVTGNLISGNGVSGVVISGTDHNIVQGNRIGTTQSGLSELGNLADGVDIVNFATYNQIGGPGAMAAGAPNIISGNHRDGVRIVGTGTRFNVLAGNLIGTDSTGQGPLGNAAHGVFVCLGAQYNLIGGMAANAGNVIAFNGKAGVSVGVNKFDVFTIHNPILSNSIFANGGLGIDLADNGVTLNTPGGPHAGPNDFQNFPVISAATVTGSTTTIQVSLDSIPNTAFVIQVFANPAADAAGYGQGQTLVATVLLFTDATGHGTMVAAVPQDLTGQYLTATATSMGSFVETSEFGKDFRVP